LSFGINGLEEDDGALDQVALFGWVSGYSELVDELADRGHFFFRSEWTLAAEVHAVLAADIDPSVWVERDGGHVAEQGGVTAVDTRLHRVVSSSFDG
jgi:hypothetical protein